MKAAYVVVEGNSDVEILRAVLDPKLLRSVEIVSAGGQGSILSLARSLLVRRSVPVAVFADSDSLNPEVIGERREQFEYLVNAAAGRTSSKVVLAVPEVEAIFFSAPDVIKGVFGQAPPEMMALGLRDPKGVLAQLGSMSHKPWDVRKAFEMMSPKDLEQLRQTPPIEELTKFLEQVQNGAVLSSSVQSLSEKRHLNG
ncbi:MAG TPA: hypothetical protein VG122_14965 [Gemmata sp.]|jgi:hypothetical protein|nr:hypothetical protein [Gemmata sp.]